MATRDFLRPRLTGKRFDGHSIPLEFLKDLAVLEEMIVEVAKWKYLQDHQDRRRIPRGFLTDISFKLSGIEEGCAIAVIECEIPQHEFLPISFEYVQKARDITVDAIKAAENSADVTNIFPEKALGYFDKIGRSLREGEAIEFTTPNKSITGTLNRETRKKLILSSSEMKEITDETFIRGSVFEANQETMTFNIKTLNGIMVKAPIHSQHFETVMEAFNNYQKGERVFIKGVGKFSRQDKLLGFESIEHIVLLDPLDVPARLDEFRSLKDGWLEGVGKALPEDGLNWFSDTFERFYPDDLPLPNVYPTEEGGIQAEWTISENEASLEVDLINKKGAWHNLNIRTDKVETKDLQLDDQKGWELLSEMISSLSGE